MLHLLRAHAIETKRPILKLVCTVTPLPRSGPKIIKFIKTEIRILPLNEFVPHMGLQSKMSGNKALHCCLSVASIKHCTFKEA